MYISITIELKAKKLYKVVTVIQQITKKAQVRLSIRQECYCNEHTHLPSAFKIN